MASSSHYRTIILGCLTVICILMEMCSSRHMPQSIYRSGNGRIFNQNGNAITFTLSTSGLFGLGTPRSSDTMFTNAARDNVMTIVNKLYNNPPCKEAIREMEMLTTRKIHIARHRGQFNANYGIHYGNSVTRITRNSDPVTLGQSLDQQTSTSLSGPRCEAGDIYDPAMGSEKKRAVEQRCRLFKLFSEEDERTIKVSNGNALKWTHISDYLGKLAETMLPAEPNINYTTIYNEAACAVTSEQMDPDTGEQKYIREFYKAYTYLVQKIHTHLYTLKNTVTEDDSNCFEELRRFLNHLTQLQESFTDTEMDKDWDEVGNGRKLRALINALDSNKVPAVVGYYNYTHNQQSESSKRANFCHKKILIEYSQYINERFLRLEELKDSVKIIKHSSLNKGITFELKRIWKPMFELLYKTYLMSNKFRDSSRDAENEEVELRITEIEEKIYNPHFNVENWWTRNLRRLLRNIERMNQQA